MMVMMMGYSRYMFNELCGYRILAKVDVIYLMFDYVTMYLHIVEMVKPILYLLVYPKFFFTLSMYVLVTRVPET